VIAALRDLDMASASTPALGQTASGQAGRIALVTATAADARDVLVEGKTNRVAFEIRMNLSAASSLRPCTVKVKAHSVPHI
jgi:phage terminase large subunit-like protein